MKIFPEQIKKILAAPIKVSGYVMPTTTNGVDITEEIETVLLTAGDGNVEVPFNPSNSSTVQGFIIDNPSNLIEVWDNTTKSKLQNNGREVFGRLESGEGYILSFYYLADGVETLHTIDEGVVIDFEFNYRFNFENLPTDAIIALKTRNVNDDPNSGANVFDEDRIYSTSYTDYVSFKTVQDALNYLIFPNLIPKFTLFELTGIDIFVEVGAPINTSVTFNWTSQQSGSIIPGSVKIYDHETSTLLYSGLNATGTQVHNFGSAPIKTVIGNTYKFRIEANTVQGYTIVKYLVFTWIGKTYYGSNSNITLTEVLLEGLTNSDLTNITNKIYEFTDGNGYKYFCFPFQLDGYAQIINFESNLIIPIQTSTLMTTNSYGISITYYIYRSYYELNADMEIIVKQE